MYNQIIPTFLLEYLQCSQCGGYLCFTPVVINSEDEQLCGKCFRTIVKKEQTKYIRQKTFEYLLQLFSFPCRYNNEGCNFTFHFNKDDGHEEICPYKYKCRNINFNDIELNNLNKNAFKSNSDLLTSNFDYDLEDETKLLTYILNIQGHNGNSLSITNKTNNKILNEDVTLCLKGTVSLEFLPKLLTNTITIHRKNRHFQNPPSVKCSTCMSVVVDDDRGQCLYGHVTCKNCSGEMCPLCNLQLNGKYKKLCENHKNGCKELISMSQISNHECPFRKIQCPLTPCNQTHLPDNLHDHLQQFHQDYLIQSTQFEKDFSTKDFVWIMEENGDLFKCVYYYYRFFVEFFVVYLGDSKSAPNFYYEVEVTKAKNSRKRRLCSDWNNQFLQPGIKFDRDELVKDTEKLVFNASVKIII